MLHKLKFICKNFLSFFHNNLNFFFFKLSLENVSNNNFSPFSVRMNLNSFLNLKCKLIIFKNTIFYID